MRFSTSLMAGALAGILISGASLAQTPAPAAPAAPAAAPAPAAAAPAPAPAPMAAGMDKKAISKACSDDADKQGLKGKPRRAFRSKCRHDKMKAM